MSPADVGHNLVPWGDEDGACVHCTLTASSSQQLRATTTVPGVAKDDSVTLDPKKTGTANQYHPKIERDTITNAWGSKEASLLVYAGITAMDQFKLFCPEELRLVDSLLDKTECTSTAPEGGKQETEDAAITTVADNVEEVAAGGASLKGTAKTKRVKVDVFRCSFCLLCEDCCATTSSFAFGSSPVVASCPAGGPNGGPLHQHPLVLERSANAPQPRSCSVGGPYCDGTSQAMWVCCTAATNTTRVAAAAAAGGVDVAGGSLCAYEARSRNVFAVCANCVARPPPDNFTRSGRAGGIADLVRARAPCSLSFGLSERFISSCLT